MLRRSNIFVEKINNIAKELRRSSIFALKISIMIEIGHPIII
ncbi:hypothetical protein SAMN05421847_0919 [Halpernia humi]|uniref:Uncharacterized protein n=1 Tax=Halpernia humi TaxID=493375 RepID=A0A1H5UTR0_9FLAO|nr:hypothetical protein SAMN05421847_0919 [Halpernia humi]